MRVGWGAEVGSGESIGGKLRLACPMCEVRREGVGRCAVKYKQCIVLLGTQVDESLLRTVGPFGELKSDGLGSIVEFDRGDPRADACVAALDHEGWTRDSNRVTAEAREKRYHVFAKRVFEPADYDQAKLFVLSVHDLPRVGRGSRVGGTLRMYADDLSSRVRTPTDVAATDAHWIVVSERAAQVLKRTELRGVDLRPIELHSFPGSGRVAGGWETQPTTYWELASNVRMPPVAACMSKWGPANRRLARSDDSVVAVMDEEKAIPKLITYNRSDLEGMPAFDYARSYENGAVGYGWYVISKRMYSVLRELGAGSACFPIAISSLGDRC